MTASVLHRRDRDVQAHLHDDVLVVDVPRARRPAWAHVVVAGLVVAAAVTAGAVTWDGTATTRAGVVQSGPGADGPVPHPQPGPLARPDP